MCDSAEEGDGAQHPASATTRPLSSVHHRFLLSVHHLAGQEKLQKSEHALSQNHFHLPLPPVARSLHRLGEELNPESCLSPRQATEFISGLRGSWAGAGRRGFPGGHGGPGWHPGPSPSPHRSPRDLRGGFPLPPPGPSGADGRSEVRPPAGASSRGVSEGSISGEPKKQNDRKTSPLPAGPPSTEASPHTRGLCNQG